MKEIPLAFEPYIGKSYRSSTTKLMVLGESHYTEKGKSDERLRNLTNDVLQTYLDYKAKRNGVRHKRWMNTFTKFSNVLNNEKLSRQKTLEFWEESAFYNFVQVSMSKARQSPSKVDFQSSYPAFKKVVEKSQPKIIIIWGLRLWQNLPKEDFILNEDNKAEFLQIPRLNRAIPILVVPHPSAGFSYSLTGPIQNFLKRANSFNNEVFLKA